MTSVIAALVRGEIREVMTGGGGERGALEDFWSNHSVWMLPTLTR